MRASCAAAAMALVALATSACGGNPHDKAHGDPDPGGRLLIAMKTAEIAIPSGAVLHWKHELEPGWDSCDGQAGTFGWNDVTMQAFFSTTLSARQLLPLANRSMRRVGWHHDGRDSSGTISWRREVSTGVAHAQLSINTAGGQTGWDLIALAPADGQRVSGC